MEEGIHLTVEVAMAPKSMSITYKRQQIIRSLIGEMLLVWNQNTNSTEIMRQPFSKYMHILTRTF